MSISKRLAQYYITHANRADAMTQLLQRYNLQSVSPQLQKRIGILREQVESLEKCLIISSVPVTADEIIAIKEKFGIPQTVIAELETDHTLVDGITVYYQGKKWNDSARGRLRRFVEIKA